MRVLLAGIFVFAGILAVVVATGPLMRTAPSLATALIPLAAVVLAVAAYYLFNRTARRAADQTEVEGEDLARMRESGLLEGISYAATRAFLVTEFEDEGPHYFIELRDGSVLSMVGQHLYEFEPDADAPDAEASRQFPCESFTVWVHHEKQYVADIECRGAVIKPYPVIDAEDCNWSALPDYPADMEILNGQTFDTLIGLLTSQSPDARRSRWS